jgi:hypothetical protein
MASLTVEKQDDVYWLRGALDENAKLAGIASAGGVLKLELSGIASINSLGVAAFLNFIDTWNGAKVEYHGCSTACVDAMIMLPAFVGPEENTAKIVSFECFYSCPSCRVLEPHRLTPEQLGWKGEDLRFPPRRCRRCREEVQVDPAAADLVNLCLSGALIVPKPRP